MCNFSIHSGALYIADRAYGKAKQMAYVMDHHADFLFRITTYHLHLYSDPACTDMLDIKEILQNAEGNRIGFTCYFKYCRSGYPVHLECFRIPDEKLRGVDRRIKTLERKRCCKFSDETKYFRKWVLLCTSLKGPFDHLLELYAKRWQIELLFKRSKTVFRFHRIRRGSHRFSFMMIRLWDALICLASHFAASSPLLLFYSFSIFSLCFA